MDNKLKAITAAWSASPTPLMEDLTVDTASVERMVKHHIRLKQQGMFIGGTCGEGPYLPVSEFRKLVSSVSQAAGSDILVAVQVTDNSYSKVIDKINDAKADGGDIAIIAEPWFCACMSEAALLKYYLESAEKSRLPVGIYSRGAKEIPAKLYKQILAHPNVKIFKDSSLNDEIMNIALEAKQTRSDLFVMTGYELGMPKYLKAGYDGILAGGGILIGAVANQMIEAAKAGEFDKLEGLQQHCESIFYPAYGGRKITSWLTGLKYTLVKMGIFSTTAGYLKYDLTESVKADIARMLEEEKDVLLP
ncbi:MAG: dihydrodipicolinate synthase family protein [Sedimentisphaeraceae bacterium JB056]